VVEALYDEAKYAAQATIAVAKTKKYWRQTEPGGSKLTGEGFITRFGRPRSNEDEMIVYTLAVQPTSKWDFTQV
jgi:hypothetical protein